VQAPDLQEVYLQRSADALARARIEQDDSPVVVPGGEYPAAGAQRQRDERISVSLHHADRSRPAHQRRQQVAASGGGVIELAPRLCEQQAPVELVVDEGLGAEALRIRGPSGVARMVALAQRENA